MQLLPKNKHLIVQSLNEGQMPSGLIVTEADKDKRPFYGRIISVQPGQVPGINESGEYAIGDVVAFDRYEAHQFLINEEMFYGVLEQRVIAIVIL